MTTSSIEYAVDMHHPSYVLVNACICVCDSQIFFDMQDKLAPEMEDQLGYSERKAFQG